METKLLTKPSWKGEIMESRGVPISKTESSHFAPLESYVTGLWKLGGLPLVLIGLGAVNLIFPNKGNYTETKQIIVTVFLFSAAILAWGSLIYLAFKRWEKEMQIAAQQDDRIIEVVARLVEGSQQDAVVIEKRVQVLITSLPQLGVRIVRPLALPGGSQS